MAAPVYANLFPADATQEVAVDTAISVEITDADGDLDASTVEITPDGVIAWTGDAVANGWTGGKTAIANGYRYDLSPPSNYSTGKNVVVRLYAEDALANVLDDSTWNFFVVGIHVLFGRGLPSSQFLYSRDGGETWSTLHANWDSGVNHGVALPTLDQAWGLVDGSNTVRPRYGTNLSFGMAVRPAFVSFGTPHSMHASAIDNVWIGAGAGAVFQYVSGDRFDAANFTNRSISGVTDIPTLGVYGLHAFSPTNVWACSASLNGGQIYQWNGSAWSQPTLVRPWNTQFLSCHGSAEDNVVFCGGIGSNTPGVVRRWNGSSFDSLDITSYWAAVPNNTHILDVYTTGLDSIWIVAGDTSGKDDDGIWFWNGSIWSKVFSPTTGNGNPRRWDSIIGHGAYKIYAISDHVEGTDKTGPIAIWDGETWTEVDSGSSHGSSTPTSVRALFTTLPDTPPDITPPILQNLNPDVDDTGVLKDATVTIEIYDDESGVNAATVVLSLDVGAGEVVAWQSDAQQNGYVVVKSAITDGFRYVITPPVDFASYQLVTVRAQADDVESNSLDESNSFRVEDYGSPGITAQAPTGTGVASDSSVSFTLTDVGESGVNSASLDSTVGGEDAIVDGVFQAGWDGPGSVISPNASNGYDVVIDPTSDFSELEVVPVTVYVEDLSGNPASSNWPFTAEDVLGPLVDPQDPTLGEVGVSVGTTVIVDVTDVGGLVSDSILIEVDSDGGGFVEVYEQGGSPEFKDGWDGVQSSVTPITNGYRIEAAPDSPFHNASTVRVRVTAADTNGNPERLP